MSCIAAPLPPRRLRAMKAFGRSVLGGVGVCIGTPKACFQIAGGQEGGVVWTLDIAGGAGVRTVAPGFSRGFWRATPFASPLERATDSFTSAEAVEVLAIEASRNPSCRPLKQAHNIGWLRRPPAEAGGYGSYAGFAGERAGYAGSRAGFAGESAGCVRSHVCRHFQVQGYSHAA